MSYLQTMFLVLAGWAIVSVPAGLLAGRIARWADTDAAAALGLEPSHVNQLFRHQLAEVALGIETDPAASLPTEEWPSDPSEQPF